MAYVPPALRRKQETALKGKDEANNESSTQQPVNSSAKHNFRSLKDIQKQFWPNWVSRTPILAQDSRVSPANVENTDHKSDQNGSTVISESDTSVGQKNIDTQPKVVPPGLAHSIEVSAKSDACPEASPQSQRSAQSMSEASERISTSLIQQPEDSLQAKEKSISDRNEPLPTESNDDTAKQRQGPTGVNLPVFETAHPHNTLNSTEQNPGSLQYVLLFQNANSRWRSDQIIFVKSALDLLPISEKDDKVQTKGTPQEPHAKKIMIFEQQNGHQIPSSAMFKFIGYFSLVKMQVLEPHTPELVRMQEQKWTRMDKYGKPKPINRNAEGWKKSLSQRWAVLGFEKDTGATEELGVPQIEISSRRDSSDETQRDTRSVNDILKEMRLKDNL